jgi:NAD-dependent dihydropyrimidine dehydrogenase PreA subunit
MQVSDGEPGMNIRDLFSTDRARHEILVQGHVVPESTRCVQCGICSYHCPINIDVRRHAWLGVPVNDSHCLTCGECVKRCPRGVLRFERTSLFGGGG